MEFRNDIRLKTLDLTPNPTPIIRGYLNLGGTNPDGQTLEVSNYYLLRNGRPFIPVMGEFHFSRYPDSEWEAELLKMKAGGIDIVATYVFWNHIEEDRGVFDWSGNRNLRQFVSLCAVHDLQVLVRMGPFAHGECRNGGLPDWLYGRPFPLRSNDTRYLAYVECWYTAIGAQITGLLFKDGGPVIGVQLENEYMHAGAPWEVTFRQGTEYVPRGSDGAEHMLTLKRLALQAGFDVPLYTSTGWVNSPLVDGEMLPMQGGYAFTPWSPDPNYQQPPTREFLFRNRHLAPVTNGEPTYDAAKYPYACCEIGGGIEDTYYHRNIVPPEAVEGLALMNLAGGANVIGYYMYHGGSNPVGKHSYLNEFTVPRISYDFQAPLGEFGQVANSFRSLRLLHLFLKDFGELLAPMGVVLPEEAATITLEDTTTLRYAVRHENGAGFLFLNNYQDHVAMQNIPNIRFELHAAKQTLTFPQSEPLTLQKQVCAILPFGLMLEGIKLCYATTQLLAKVGDTYFFFAPRGMLSEYAFDETTYRVAQVGQDETVHRIGQGTCITVTPGLDAVITLENCDGKTVRIVTLTREQAEHASKHQLGGQERLVITEATVVSDRKRCFCYSVGQAEVSLAIYPPTNQIEQGTVGGFMDYPVQAAPKTIDLVVEKVDEARTLVKLPPQLLDGVDDVLLRIDYIGDIGNCFIDGKLVADNFYNGRVWEIGLKRFVRADQERELLVWITPLKQNPGVLRLVPTGMAFRPEGDETGLAVINNVTAVPVYKITLGDV